MASARFQKLSLALTVFLSLVQFGTAATVGLWNFDTMTDATYATAISNGDPPGGETLFDSSGNSLNLVSTYDFGTTLLSNEVSEVMASNTNSLYGVQPGARMFQTPSSSLLHRGNTGELTIEFWFNYLRPAATLGYIAAFDGGDATNVGNWDIYGDANGDIRFGTFSSGGAYTEVKTSFAAGYDAADGQWHHIAFTVNNAGTMASYFDGQMVQQSAVGAVGAASTALPDKLNLGFWRPSATFGDHDFLIDELRISNVALLPGSGTGVNQLAWNAQLATPPVVLPPRDANFGKEWIRDRDFTMSAWDATKFYTQYKQSGFNAVLGGGPEAIAAGVEDHYLGAFSQLDNVSRTEIHIALNQGVSAFMLKDEIPPGDISGIGEVAEYIRSLSPDAFLIAGLGSSNPSYIDDIVNTIKPEAVVHAYYPFQGTTNATDDWFPALSNTALVRERTLHHNVAYFSYVQTFEDFLTGSNTIDDNRRLPTESEFRAEAFAKLSAGAKGLVFFRFQNNPLTEDEALIDPNGNTSPLYAPVASANQEILNLGKSLRHLTSTDWRFLSGGVSATPAEMSAWNASAGNGLIDAISIGGPSLARKDGLVGYFTDDDGDDYFMLANTYHGDSLNAAAAAVSFTITFDSAVDIIWRLNRLTGLVEQINLTNSILNLTLPGGTGDLFKFGDGNFAGLAAANGDFDGDGDVDGRDFLKWQRGQSPNPYSSSDLALWQQTYGNSQLTAASTSVPEPSVACLALVLSFSSAFIRCRVS
jgi:hypothetical protein